MSKRRAKGVRLEMTPLMDVMFLVLVFFIYCIFDMSVHRGVKVDLPEGAGAEERGEQIVLTITADDALEFNGQPTTRSDAVTRVAELYRVKMRLPVLIAGDRRSSLGLGIGLLEELRRAGVEKVSFQVNGEK